ncbi:methyl-accepting chemotaxis protein [Paenibacillus sp. CMAA1364]
MSKLKLGRKVRVSIGTKMGLLIVGVILVLSISITMVVQRQVSTVMMELFQERIEIDSELGYNLLDQEYPGAWSLKDGHLFKGTTKIDSMNEFVDTLGTITGGAVTLAQEDVRVATNIFNGQERNVGTKVDPLVTDVVIKHGKTYVGKADVTGELYLTIYSPLKNESDEVIGIWSVASSIHQIDIKVNMILTIVYILMAIVGLLAVFISMIFIRRIIRPMIQINRQLHDIAEGGGDLTQVLNISSRDEVGDLAQSFNKMISNLRDMIRQIGITAQQVAASSEELTASSEQTSRAAEENASSLQNMAMGSGQQLRNIADGVITFDEMSKGIDQIATNAQAVSSTAGYAFDK